MIESDKIIKIVNQGAPVLNSVYVVYQNEDIIVLCLDMKSKYCVVGASSTATVFIDANERSLNLKEGMDRELSTEVRVLGCYPHFLGSSSGRYSIFVAFCSDRTYFAESSTIKFQCME